MSRPLAFIVEDDPRLSDIFAETVRSAGYEVELFLDGHQVLARLAQIEPALVMLDLHLIHVNGKEVLAYIHTQKRLQNTTIMLATADDALARNLEDQCDLVLLKPISVTQLRRLASRLRP